MANNKNDTRNKKREEKVKDRRKARHRVASATNIDNADVIEHGLSRSGAKKRVAQSLLASLPTQPLKRHVGWLTTQQQDAKSDLSLTEEIALFASYVELTETERRARECLLEDLQEAVRARWEDAEVVAFGSYAAGLSIFCSDVDLAVLFAAAEAHIACPPSGAADDDGAGGRRSLLQEALDIANANDLSALASPPPLLSAQGLSAEATAKRTRTRRMGLLHRLSRQLRRLDWATQLELRQHAKVPIIRLTHRCGVQSDVTLGLNEDTLRLARAMAACCGPRVLFELSALLKLFLQQLQLDEPYTGGLGSFKLYVLLTAFCQRHPELLGRDRARSPSAISDSGTAIDSRADGDGDGDAEGGGADTGLLLLRFLEHFGRAEHLKASTVVTLTLPAPPVAPRAASLTEAAAPIASASRIVATSDAITVRINFRGNRHVKVVQCAFAAAYAALRDACREKRAQRQLGPGAAGGDASHSFLARLLVSAPALQAARQESAQRAAAYLQQRGDEALRPVDGVGCSKKNIFVVVPPTEKNGEAEVISVPVSSEKDLESFCEIHCGSLSNSSHIKATFKNLVEDGTYRFYGAFDNATENNTRRRQVDDKILKFESALTVKNAVGSDAQIHPKVVFEDGNNQSVMELDAVVHLGGKGVANSTAYIVEAAYSPQENEVKVLSDKVEQFKKLAANHPHFKTVNNVIPVLAGRHWSQQIVDATKAAKQWRVVPSGAGYQIVRGLHFLMKRIVK